MSPKVRPLVLVDDEENDVFFSRRLLLRAAPERAVLVFNNGEEAVDYLSRASTGESDLPAVVFLDVRMSGMNGFDVLAHIRSSPALAVMSVCMLSSSAEPEDVTRARQLGAQCYVVKHPPPEVIARVIAEADAAAVRGAATVFCDITSSLLPTGT